MDSYPIWEIQKDLSGGKIAYHLWKSTETSPPYLFAMGKLAHYGRINGWMAQGRMNIPISIHLPRIKIYPLWRPSITIMGQSIIFFTCHYLLLHMRNSPVSRMICKIKT
jgi:hypothetical protein